MRRFRSTVLLFALLLGCDGSESTTAGGGGSGTTGTGGGGGGPTPSAERGEYIAEALGPCGQCHTPKLPSGAPDDSRHFGGNDCFVDVVPEDDTAGCIATPNLTNHETGLKSYSDAEIKEMITKGKRPDGTSLFPLMPYWVIHTLPDHDIDSIILYLRTLPPVDHEVPANQAPFDDLLPMPAPPLAEAEIPMPTVQNEATMRGRPLAVFSCLTCHTPLKEITDLRSIDGTKLFAGGNTFVAATLGYPAPPLPDVIYSTNLTPHPDTGAGYTKDQLVALLKSGKDKDGKGYCPPMPVANAYGKLTDQDLSDMADYLVALPPVDNAVPGTCEAP